MLGKVCSLLIPTSLRDMSVMTFQAQRCQVDPPTNVCAITAMCVVAPTILLTDVMPGSRKARVPRNQREIAPTDLLKPVLASSKRLIWLWEDKTHLLSLMLPLSIIQIWMNVCLGITPHTYDHKLTRWPYGIGCRIQ